MIISINQPAYLPWLGYFHRIGLSDMFVYFDTTQFEKNSFVNRNKIKTSQGPLWLTVPVKLKGHFNKKIKEIEIADQSWQRKHWDTIIMNYKKAKYWKDYSEALESFYNRKYKYISDLCYKELVLFNKLLGLKTKIIKTSELAPSKAHKQDLILEICKSLNSNSYISGALGRDYLDLKQFNKNNIKVYFQNYKSPIYNQLWEKFVPNLSVLDLLLNEGPNSLNIIFNNNVNKKDLSNNLKLYE
jgi:hypothetical protein